MSYIGAHIISNPKYLLEATQLIYQKGGNLVQIFIDPLQVGITSRPIPEKTGYNEFKKFIKDHQMKFIVHASYTINLARDWEPYSSNIQEFILEVNASYELGADSIVVHMGKQLEFDKETALNNMYTGLLHVHEETKMQPIKILLETSTGQGSEICFKIEEFAYFFKKLSKNKNKEITKRFGICIDTCHIYAAGYDITNKMKVYTYIESFEELIGLRHIGLIHLNDSKKGLGSNVDRHENIGKGFIGKEGLIEFIKYFKKVNVPIILETPDSYIDDDLRILINT